MLGVLLAVCAAISNAIGTVYQRKAARAIPDEEAMRPALVWELLRRPVWLVGLAGLTGGFVFQAGALHFAELTLVQPIVVFELPLTLALAARVFRRPIDRYAVWGTLAVSAGISLVLIAIDPQPGHPASGAAWLVAVPVSVATLLGLALLGLRTTASRRAALFGVAAGFGFGFTAALMNGSLQALDDGPAALFGSWLPYATVAAGLTSVFLTQNALQAGSIVAAQPAITSCDPLASVLYGVLIFEERLRGGFWLIPAGAGAVLAIAGTMLLARSPLIEAQDAATSRDPVETGRPDERHW